MRRFVGALFVLLMMLEPAFAQQSKAAVDPAQREFSAKQPEASTAIIIPQGRVRLSPEETEKLRQQLNYAFEVATVSADVCYTMHSFVFKRYNGGDATRLVKQTTCTPASQFRAKRATMTKSR